MQGKRIDNPPGVFGLGEYGKVGGEWHCCAPRDPQTGDDFNRFHGNLAAHDVVEHEDGTITVSPSILITTHFGQWHGYLERGVWREC